MIVEAPESLPTLPSSVEVAAYRIAAEALTNIVRHSDAKLASVRLTTDDGTPNDGTPKMIITDDGTSNGAWSPGLGLTSIQLRAHSRGRQGDCHPSAGSESMIKVSEAIKAAVTCSNEPPRRRFCGP
jgi:signal transduction histidine kinase